MKIIMLVLVAQAALLTQPSTALCEDPSTVSIGPLIEEALATNAGLKAKESRYAALRSGVIGSWLPMDPLAGVDLEGQSDALDLDSRMNDEYMLEQDIPFPSKMLLRRLAASKAADTAYQEYLEERLQLTRRLSEPYIRLVEIKSTIELLGENRALLEQALRSARSAYESGRATQGDVLKAQIELSKIDIELFDAHEESAVQEASLSSALNRPAGTRYAVEATVARSAIPLSLSQLEERALRARPELKAYALRSERAGIERDLARQAWLPDVRLRYEKRRFRADGDPDQHDTFVGLTVPVWGLIGGLGGGWAAADAEAREALSQLEQARHDLVLQLRKAYSAYRRAENALDIYESGILPQALQQAEVSLAAYEAGRADFMTVVDAQRTLRESRIAYYRAWAESRLALVELDAYCGGGLL